MVIDRQQKQVFDLSGEILAAFRDATASVVYSPGETLFYQGERLSRIIFIDQGLCKLVWRTPDGGQALVGLRSRGWPVGSAYALLEREQPFAVESVGRCSVRQIPLRLFSARLDEHPQLMGALLHLHGLKLAQAQTFHLLGLASLRARRRVEMLLSWLHDAGIAVPNR
jgi:CRP-like cAMP-binding protein